MSRIDQILQYLKESPDDAFLNYALAQEYISAGNDAGAEKLFITLLEKQPDYIATYYHYGKLLERDLKKTEAMELYRRGIEKAKDAKEMHSLAELQSALLELEYE